VIASGASSSIATMAGMVQPPEFTKTPLRPRLTAHARERWPQLADAAVRCSGAFALHQRSPGPTAARCPFVGCAHS